MLFNVLFTKKQEPQNEKTIFKKTKITSRYFDFVDQCRVTIWHRYLNKTCKFNSIVRVTNKGKYEAGEGQITNIFKRISSFTLEMNKSVL